LWIQVIRFCCCKGIKRAAEPAGNDSPFGYGKEIYFWSFIVAILIIVLGAGVSIYEGIRHVQSLEPIFNPTVKYIVLGLAILFEGAAWYAALYEFRKGKGKWSYFKAPKIHRLWSEDSAVLLGLVVVFLGIRLPQVTGILRFDGLVSIIIGLILTSVAIWLAIETKEVEHAIVAIDQEIKARNTLVKRVFIEAESRQSFV
jgi:divalent metal cation (Fe/Co/Zn/Cd) transporter